MIAATATPKRLGRQLGGSFHVLPEAIEADAVRLRNQGYLVTAGDYARDLRRIADAVESEALSARNDLDGLSESSDAHGQLLERTIPELGHIGIVHDSGRRIGVVRSILGVLNSCLHHLHPSNRTGGVER